MMTKLHKIGGSLLVKLLTDKHGIDWYNGYGINNANDPIGCANDALTI